MNLENIKKVDPQVAEQIELELQRQQETIELIASENCTSEAVMEHAEVFWQINMRKANLIKDIITAANI